MHIRYPIHVNLQGDLVDDNGTIIAQGMEHILIELINKITYLAEGAGYDEREITRGFQ